uniref:Uncharacterized protein n=1 Tax=Glycine max TaxID=3847 RepID=A0A0R0GAG1_SOYBN
MFGETAPRPKFVQSEPRMSATEVLTDDEFAMRRSSTVSPMSSYCSEPGRLSGEGSPMMMSPWNQTTNSSFSKPHWSQEHNSTLHEALVGSLIRQEGHIYSLAASGDLLFTGSDSKNIRVWKNLKEHSGFKSNSGLVRRHKTALWIRHSDAVSCLSLSEDKTYLYSASWDRTIKVWRISDSRCLESIHAHDDAVNSVVCGDGDVMFSGSADGTVKVWRREMRGKGLKHAAVKTLLKQEYAVTALAVGEAGSMVYCGASDGLVNCWGSGKNYAHGGVLKGHKLAVLCLAAAGTLVFSGSADKTLCVWKREGVIHTCVSVLTGHNGPLKCLAVEENRESGEKGEQDRRWVLYSGSLDKSVKIWSVSE